MSKKLRQRGIDFEPHRDGSLTISAKHRLNLNDMETIHKYFQLIGAKGGKKSKRTLTAEQARAMVKAREAKRKKK